jgi:hypothetical protein
MEKKKMTKRQMYEKILAHTTDKDEKEFLLHEIELLDKKAGKVGEKKLSPTQEANEKLKTAILDGLEGVTQATISEMIKTFPECAELSTSKVSALVRQLKEVGLVKRTEVKGVAYFSKV